MPLEYGRTARRGNYSFNFAESPYSWFVQESPLQILLSAIRMLRRFAIEHERAWLDNAQQLLEA